MTEAGRPAPSFGLGSLAKYLSERFPPVPTLLLGMAIGLAAYAVAQGETLGRRNPLILDGTAFAGGFIFWLFLFHIRVFDEHKDSDLMILSISMDEPETQGDVRTYIKQRGYTFPVLLDTETQVTNQLNPRRAAPFTLVIGKDEIIAWDHEGYVPGDEKELEATVLKALGLTAP